jgi:hypothetical protein
MPGVFEMDGVITCAARRAIRLLPSSATDASQLASGVGIPGIELSIGRWNGWTSREHDSDLAPLRGASMPARAHGVARFRVARACLRSTRIAAAVIAPRARIDSFFVAPF